MMVTLRPQQEYVIECVTDCTKDCTGHEKGDLLRSWSQVPVVKDREGPAIAMSAEQWI
jgi:hypothetical protein